VFYLAFLVLAGAMTAAIGPACARDATVISGISIEGNRRIEAASVQAHLKLAPGHAYDAARADASLKALYATGLFADVRIEQRGTSVIVTVKENPLVDRVAFEGSSAIDKKTLESEIQLKSRVPFTRAKAQADRNRIIEVYRRQGYYAAKVEPKIIQREQGRIDLVFEITEGKVIKVAAINFAGHQVFTADALRGVVSTSESGTLDFLKTSVIHDPDRMNLDRELLRAHYLKNGYADMRVVSAAAELDAAQDRFIVTFVIEEGPKYAFGAIGIQSSLSGVDTRALSPLVEAKAGATYNAQLIDRSVEALTLHLAKYGQPFARVKPRADRNSAARIIGLNFVIDEGPRLFVERLEIRGNKLTKDAVIRREFRIKEGDALNAHLLDKARLRLMALGFFKKVEIKKEAGSAPDRTIVAVEVVEESTGSFSVGAGYSSTEGLIGDISYTERNLLGNGQYLKLKVSGSAVRQQVDIGFTEPRFLGSNVAAGFDLFHKEQDLTAQASYKARTTGGDIRLGFALAENWSSTVNYTLTRKEIFGVGEGASAAVKEAANFPAAASNTYYTSSVGYQLAYDTRDRAKNPTRGIYVSTSQDLAGLGGDVRYLRSVAEGRAYYSPNENVTLVGRAIGGTITGWGDDNVRLLDMFYKGGESVRGFATAGIGPRDSRSTNQDALGGRNFYTTTAEARFDIPYVPKELGLRGAMFADAGAVWGAGAVASTLPGTVGTTLATRASVGAGLVWDSPLGPIRADYAVPVLKQAFDKTQPFSFGAGGLF
jgi:outer membrane protein insertion porin family